MGLRIVDPIDHGIFKMDAPAGYIVIAAAGLHQLRNGIGLVDRHDPAADLVIGPVEGNGQRDLELLLRQLINLRHQAAGGQADMAHGNVHAVGAVDQFQEPQHILKIVQRLANAHQHNVGNG